MRIVSIGTLTLTGLALGGCMSLHAHVPEDALRRHLAREDGVEIGALCSHEGRAFSEGARLCMAQRRMTCDPTARWVEDGACP